MTEKAVNGNAALSRTVMAGLVPAIDVFLAVVAKNVDARDKPGHDEPLFPNFRI
jgi:hypothetical protein